jgi:hypothetical protein
VRRPHGLSKRIQTRLVRAHHLRSNV